MLSALDLELFAVHLAIHLCGADPIRQRVSEKTEFQLYWRSPLLQKSSTTTGIDSRANNGTNGARRLLFIDVTFDFGRRLDGTAHDAPEASLVCYRFGSLWENAVTSNGESAATDAAVYYTGAPIQAAELERHFLDASIDEASTPAPILAQSLALALQGLTPTSLLDRGNHAHADNATTGTQERLVPLYYSDVDSWADWNVGGEQSSAVSGPVLQMMVLQQQMQTLSAASANEASSASANNVKEVGQVCDLVLDEWKPAMVQELRTRMAKPPPPPSAVEQAVPVASSDVSLSVPPSTTSTTIESDDAAAADTERTVLAISTTKPLPTIAAAAAADIPSVRPSGSTNNTATVTSAPVSKKVVKKKGAAHGFAKINAKKPKRGGLQFAD
jgi:hypothetical protein